MRLFLAVAADSEVKAAAAGVVGRLRRAPGDYRWVDPRDTHVTLRFIGETPEDTLPEFEQLMRETAGKTTPFEIAFGCVDAFESIDDPRVVWIGIERGLEPLQALAERLGRDESRPFTPHLTLGRRRRATDPAAFARALREESTLGLRRPVSKISLYASRPASFGHTYEILSEAALGG